MRGAGAPERAQPPRSARDDSHRTAGSRNGCQDGDRETARSGRRAHLAPRARESERPGSRADMRPDPRGTIEGGGSAPGEVGPRDVRAPRNLLTVRPRTPSCSARCACPAQKEGTECAPRLGGPIPIPLGASTQGSRASRLPRSGRRSPPRFGFSCWPGLSAERGSESPTPICRCRPRMEQPRRRWLRLRRALGSGG